MIEENVWKNVCVAMFSPLLTREGGKGLVFILLVSCIPVDKAMPKVPSCFYPTVNALVCSWESRGGTQFI